MQTLAQWLHLLWALFFIYIVSPLAKANLTQTTQMEMHAWSVVSAYVQNLVSFLATVTHTRYGMVPVY